MSFDTDDEVRNYGPIRGTITYYFAHMLTWLSCGLQQYDIPRAVKEIRYGAKNKVSGAEIRVVNFRIMS